MIRGTEEFEEEEPAYERVGSEGQVTIRQNYRYTVTVRRQITVFEDALASANGLKRGEQQILNLTATDPQTRQKIVDFMSGVNYAQEGTWEEIGENVYLIVPSNAYVEVAPPTPRMSAIRN
ncbi:MAG TPA: cell division protein SepF [Fimbriimonas sp.]|nr:cell division protein SepF [Fimbriimonas sp.]